jgi:hypothetical protein
MSAVTPFRWSRPIPFWVDGYFEKTNLFPIRVGDPAQIKPMGHDQIVRGHVDSIARAINVSNAQPNGQGIATVNPIFTWLRPPPTGLSGYLTHILRERGAKRAPVSSHAMPAGNGETCTSHVHASWLVRDAPILTLPRESFPRLRMIGVIGAGGGA